MVRFIKQLFCKHEWKKFSISWSVSEYGEVKKWRCPKCKKTKLKVELW